MSKLSVSTDVPTEIHMVRLFDAPRHLVHKAMSEPALIKQWLGGVRARVTSAEVDLRVGGSYRYVFALPDGSSFFFTGVFREVGDDRIVHSELFNGEPPGSVVTTTFVEQGGKTTVNWVIAFESQEIRDMVLSTGMADGAGESYDELEKLLAGL
jgi:uncharacterized protein YndB with AHSA1/START domain